MDKSLSISVFCLYLSMYSIATIGIDRYVRIKHYASFKALLDCKSCVNVHMYTGISCFLSSRNGSHKYFLGKKSISTPIYIAIDVTIFSAIIFLQILTIRSPNALHNDQQLLLQVALTKRLQNSACELCYCYSLSSRHAKSFMLCVTSFRTN